MRYTLLNVFYRNFLCLIILLLPFSFSALGSNYKSIDLLNSTNWASYLGKYTGYLYDSHGCLHFTPSDIYLLVKTIPKGTPMTIKRYNEKNIPDNINNLPIFNTLVNSTDDVNKYANMFQNSQTKLVVYPSQGKLLIYQNDDPFVQVNTLAGPPQFYKQAFGLEKDGEIEWDFTDSTPTDAGNYKIMKGITHYISNTYYLNTVVPFGAWIEKRGNDWVYQDGNNWYALPQHIAEDLSLPSDQREYLYFDVSNDSSGKATAARWGNNDFGKYALLWSKDGKTVYPELGYCEGILLFEQTVLVEDLANILTVAGNDDLDSCVSQNSNFVMYRDTYNFIQSSGESVSSRLDPVVCSYYRLFNHLKMTEQDMQNIDQRLFTAFNTYEKIRNSLPTHGNDRTEKMIGLYSYLRDYDSMLKKQANWYAMLKDDWGMWQNLRISLRNDFLALSVYSNMNRQLLVEKALNDRLEFKLVSPPAPKKERLSFTSFFSQEAVTSVFSQREKEALKDIINQAASGEVNGPIIKSVDALNNVNFCLFINGILGNLYKSHGCLHVAPRNIYLLHRILPVGCKVTIKDYLVKPDDKEISNIPYLVELVNFEEDFNKFENDFANPEDVRITVYPSAKLWVIYLKGKPFACMTIEPGPEKEIKIIEKRDSKGKPTFLDVVAYPSTPGNFYVFKKLVNYISNLYYDTTLVPQGAQIKNANNKWIFQDENGNWKPLPDSIQADILLPPDKRTESYYDEVYDLSGSLILAKWGSNDFGKYPIQMSADKKTSIPELIHTSGTLMLEERYLVEDLIRILSAPEDSLEDCIKYSKNFGLYAACYEFIQDPSRKDLLDSTQTSCYKLFMGLPLDEKEKATIPKDAFIAEKIIKGQGPLTKEENDLLVQEGIASWKGNNLTIDIAKIYGIWYDVYQYMIATKKGANTYAIVQKYWDGLSTLRQTMLADFKTFVISDADLFCDFTVEMIMQRIQLKKLTQKDTYKLISELITEKNN